MPELRKDPILDHWVAFAKDRALRPSDFEAVPRRRPGAVCPFCEGNEHLTPSELMRVRREGAGEDSARWEVRVVENKYPAVHPDREYRADKIEGILLQSIPGFGAHEVIIESPRHILSLTELSALEFTRVIEVYRARFLAHRSDSRPMYPMLFKNNGPEAGASLEHAHSQLIVLPTVPSVTRAELEAARRYREAHGECVFCDLIAREISTKERLVAESESFAAFCPFAARFSYETWVLPKCHAGRFESLDDSLLAEFSRLFLSVLRRIEAVLDRPAYNYYIHTSPLKTENDCGCYHWHLEITPRLSKMAGYELGSGYYINPVLPEDAASRLRAGDENG